MFYKFLDWMDKWIKENPYLAIYVATVKGIIIGILISQYLIK